MSTILHLDASARHNASISRKLSAQLVEARRNDGDRVIHRDLDAALPLLTEEMVEAYFTAPDVRSETQKTAIAVSDELVAELQASDEIIIGSPIYNFGPPAALKAWADLTARAGVTFRYAEDGPVGLLDGKKAFLVVTSGGTEIGSTIDYLTPWARRFLSFIGITDVTVLTADALSGKREGDPENVHAAVDDGARSVAA